MVSRFILSWFCQFSNADLFYLQGCIHLRCFIDNPKVKKNKERNVFKYWRVNIVNMINVVSEIIKISNQYVSFQDIHFNTAVLKYRFKPQIDKKIFCYRQFKLNWMLPGK